MYEHRRSPPLPPRRFVLRVLRHAALAALLLAGSLWLGMAG